MPQRPQIRPMGPEDATGAAAVARAVLFEPWPGEDEEARLQRSLLRIRHLVGTDPGGAWVAEHEGEIVGVALALLREGVWGLSLLAVAEAHQGCGVGRELLAAAYAYGDGAARGHIVLSSERPAAMRSYARLGLELRPAVAAAGIVDRSRIPDLDGVVEAGADGIGTADAIGRAVRGAGHGRDLAVALASGGRLFLLEDRAFGVVVSGDVMLLAGRDEEAATRVLWALFEASAPGATINIGFVTAGQDWAVRACLDAGLVLSPDGPVFTGGELGPLRPYLPSGAYL
jgi:GNAT superfamily N-acetyltransferase